VTESVCVGRQAIASPRDGIQGQHQLGGRDDAPDRFAIAFIKAVRSQPALLLSNESLFDSSSRSYCGWVFKRERIIEYCRAHRLGCTTANPEHVFGAGLIITTRKINEIQAEELRQFQLGIEGEQQKTAKAQREAAEAKLALKRYVDDVAEKERAARLQIDRKVGTRYLTSDEGAKLKSQLAAFSGQSIDIIGFQTTNDDERHGFAKTIFELFTKCGWHANLFWIKSPDAYIAGLRVDLFAGGADGEKTTAATTALVRALREAVVAIADPSFIPRLASGRTAPHTRNKTRRLNRVVSRQKVNRSLRY
jgi:hypothetical protein